jgi:cellulose biosynthesis protein BcsQ
VYTITFYSYKGVGRTMALVNVAAELAMRGRKVLLVDFDLESPALDTAARLRPKAWHLGLVEYVAHYASTGRAPPLEDYVYDAGAFGDKGGRIWVMPAGLRDRDYRLALARLDWISLYQNRNGCEFVNQMKQQWEDLYHPDYVLIDCRSGHTNVEGICTRQLPDAVVVLFFPDLQNRAGLSRICRDVRTETDRGRPDPIALHFVMSNVPLFEDEGEELSRRQEGWLQGLRIPGLAAVLHHREGFVAFDREILVLDRPKARLAREYRALVDALIVHNVEDEQGGLLLMDQMERAYSQGPVGMELEEEEERLDRFRDRHYENAPFLVRMARCLMADRRFDAAERLLDRVLADLQPKMPEALLLRARCRKSGKDSAGAVDDLLTYLGTVEMGQPDLDLLEPGENEESALSALRQLLRLAPEQFDDLRKRDEVQILLHEPDSISGMFPFDGPPWVQALGRLDRLKLKVLLHPEETIAWAGLRGKMQRLEQERTRLLAEKPVDERERNRNAFELACTYFHLALAHWEATGSLPRDLCEEGLVYHNRVAPGFKGNYRTMVLKEFPSYRQLVALALWRTGHTPEALKEIDEAYTTVHGERDTYYESHWRGLEEVTPEQFLEDCEQIRNLILGVPDIQPAFLREASSS